MSVNTSGSIENDKPFCQKDARFPRKKKKQNKKKKKKRIEPAHEKRVMGDQERLRQACALAQSRQSLCFSQTYYRVREDASSKNARL